MRDLFLSEPGTVVRVAREDEPSVTADTPVAAPTLVLSGGADPVVTPEHPKRLLEAIPQAREYVTPTHHMASRWRNLGNSPGWWRIFSRTRRCGPRKER